jgi:hypothetical protein
MPTCAHAHLPCLARVHTCTLHPPPPPPHTHILTLTEARAHARPDLQQRADQPRRRAAHRLCRAAVQVRWGVCVLCVRPCVRAACVPGAAGVCCARCRGGSQRQQPCLYACTPGLTLALGRCTSLHHCTHCPAHAAVLRAHTHSHPARTTHTLHTPHTHTHTRHKLRTLQTRAATCATRWPSARCTGWWARRWSWSRSLSARRCRCADGLVARAFALQGWWVCGCKRLVA